MVEMHSAILQNMFKRYKISVERKITVIWAINTLKFIICNQHFSFCMVSQVTNCFINTCICGSFLSSRSKLHITDVKYSHQGDKGLLSVQVYNPSLITSEFDVSLQSCNVTIKGHLKKVSRLDPHQTAHIYLFPQLQKVHDSFRCTGIFLRYHAWILHTFSKSSIFLYFKILLHYAFKVFIMHMSTVWI